MTTSNRTLTGSSHHPGHIDSGTLGRQHSSSQTLAGAPRHKPSPTRLNALIFDEEFITRFLSSVAHAIVLQRNTKVVWVEYKDSKVLNGLYAAMNVLLDVGAPGTAQVESADINRINSEKVEMEMHLYDSFVTAMTRGPARVMRYLNLQDELRTSSLESVQGVYRDVSQINQGVEDQTKRGIARLSLPSGA